MVVHDESREWVGGIDDLFLCAWWCFWLVAAVKSVNLFSRYFVSSGGRIIDNVM